MQNHNRHRLMYIDFTSWLQSVKDSLDRITDAPLDTAEGTEQQRAELQSILAAKDVGLEKLTAVVESGEKLNPETNAAGRDKIRSQLRTAKEVWDALIANCSDMQRKLDARAMQWNAHKEGIDQLLRWLSNTEDQLRTGTELKAKLDEKKRALQQAKVDFADLERI